MVICNENDPQYPPEKAEIVDGILGGGQYAPGYLKDYYASCNHGFAVRGDMVSLIILTYMVVHDLKHTIIHRAILLSKPGRRVLSRARWSS
jgi:hypothetical protein